MMFLTSELFILIGFMLAMFFAFRAFYSNRGDANQHFQQQSQQYPYPPYYPPYPSTYPPPMNQRLAAEQQIEKLVKFIIAMLFVSFVTFVLLRSAYAERKVKNDWGYEPSKEKVDSPARAGA